MKTQADALLAYQQEQRQLAGHLRNPCSIALPTQLSGEKSQRVTLYQQLIFNNIEALLAGVFPRLKTLMMAQWPTLIADFIAQHRAQTPYFLEVSQELLFFLQDTSLPVYQQWPFIYELAHYEWVELVLSVAADEDVVGVDASIDTHLLTQKWRVASTAWPVVYHWPVDKISPNFVPSECGDVLYWIAYRDEELTVQWLSSNAVTLRLLALIATQTACDGEQVLALLAAELQRDDIETIRTFGRQLFEQLQSLGVIVAVTF